MPNIGVEAHQQMKRTLEAMRQNRLPWWQHWRDLANYILPRRYVWLESDNEFKNPDKRNKYILDGTGTQAARTLASGMMNGVTSPARPWFRLRIPGVDDEEAGPAREWLDDVAARMLLVMAESNFYNAIAVMYLDLVVFGTSAMLIYEDYDEVVRCYNCALGEYYIAQDYRLQVNTFAREFTYKVHQVVARWGLENCSTTVQNRYKEGGASLQQDVKIVHLIEPVRVEGSRLRRRFRYSEHYWEAAGELGLVLESAKYRELPGIFPRWEITGNEAYGNSPGMDALPDIIQLQFETKAKAKALDLMNQPPMLVDAQLRNKPNSMLPRGTTYVSGLSNNSGARPAYTVNPPLQEMTADILDIRQRIREIFHNDLFKMISQLDTVRSATEIDARREEKLVLLGPVLERFENEGLDPGIVRIFSIMDRKGLLPPPPPGLENVELEIQYVSVLSDAQRAVGTAAHERFAQFVGNLAPVRPDVLAVPDWTELVRDYGQRIGVPGRVINTREETAAVLQRQQQAEAMSQAAEVGPALTGAAKQLSETQVGGGANVLTQLMEGG